MTRRVMFVLLLTVSVLALTGLAVRAYSARGGTVGATVHVDPLSASISVNRATLKTGQNGRVSASVANHGSDGVISVRLEIVAPAAVSVTPGAFVVATLGGDATRSSLWTICGAHAGNYIIVARATAVDASGRSLLAESPGVIITIEGRPKPCR